MNYLLDIDTLLQVMQGYHNASAWLYAKIELREGSYRAELSVHNGVITSCVLRDGTGNVRYEEAFALQIVQGYGTADWTLHLQAPGESSPTPAQTIPIPYRRVAAIPEQWSLPRMHAHIFSLIDGQRDIEQIWLILSRSITKQGMEQILRDLQKFQLIGFR